MIFKYIFLLVVIFQPIISQFFHNENAQEHIRKVRIIGGQDATPHQFPFQVGLYIDYDNYEKCCNFGEGNKCQASKGAEMTSLIRPPSTFPLVLCGGSLISLNYVLSAAHCLEGAFLVEVILGAHNISDDLESSRQSQKTSSYIIHPDWNCNNVTNDIGLVKLNTPAEINEYVQTITLASGSNSYVGQRGTALGWGGIIYKNESTVNGILQYVSNVILSNKSCKEQTSSYNFMISDVKLCLSGVTNKGFWQGDSGSPLVVADVQVGVASFFNIKTPHGMPTVFARVTKFASWIKENSDILKKSEAAEESYLTINPTIQPETTEECYMTINPTIQPETTEESYLTITPTMATIQPETTEEGMGTKNVDSAKRNSNNAKCLDSKLNIFIVCLAYIFI